NDSPRSTFSECLSAFSVSRPDSGVKSFTDDATARISSSCRSPRSQYDPCSSLHDTWFWPIPLTNCPRAPPIVTSYAPFPLSAKADGGLPLQTCTRRNSSLPRVYTISRRGQGSPYTRTRENEYVAGMLKGTAS